MDDIPQEVLYDALQSAQRDTPADFLRTVANDFTDRADRERSLRKKSWQSRSKELDTVAGHIIGYAEQLAQFAENNPAERPVPAAEPHPDAVPGLPGNTGRCAAFRRATPDDQTLCGLERGHDGDHIQPLTDGGPISWPRTPSGAVCGDVAILHDGTALNCARPLGHDGDEHHDGRFRLWPRGVGTSRQVRTCERCNTDTHTCPGCGEPLSHFVEACAKCTAESERETADGVGGATGLPAEPPLTTEDELFPGQCEARQGAERCMLPGTHTGRHKGRQGSAWDREPEPAATLGEIAEQQRAAMVIPEQRAESDPAFTIRESDGAAVYNGLLAAPEMAHVAAMKEEVTAIVGELSNPFQPITQTVGIGPGPALGNPFQAQPAPPPEPPAAFLPPHMVPGAPKAYQSHSSITRMEKCGLQYRLHYRDRIGDDTPAWWNVAGTAFHLVVQAIEAAHASAAIHWAPDGNLMEQERAAHAAWKDAFATLVEQTERESGKARSTWKAAKGGKEGEAWWREYGGDLARMYVAHRRRFLAEPEGWQLLARPGGEGWAHEVPFSATVDGVLLEGFIDAAWISADGATILIEDFKSGSSEGDPFQPKLYGAALRAMGFLDGRRVVTRFYEARKGAHSPTVELTSADDAEVSYRANTAAMMDRAGIFPPSPSGYNCSTCPVKSRCPIMATKG